MWLVMPAGGLDAGQGAATGNEGSANRGNRMKSVKTSPEMFV
jgi:hypothetical protein